MRFKNFIPYVLLSVCSTSFAIPPPIDGYRLPREFQETIITFLQNNTASFDELLQFVSKLENEPELEDKYDINEITAFLACVAKLGVLYENSPSTLKLNQDILELIEEIEADREIARLEGPSWHTQVYFPNELSPLTIQPCGLIKSVKKGVKKSVKKIGNAIEKVGHAVEKGAKVVFNYTKTTVMGIVEMPFFLGNTIEDSFTKPSKKAWKKTKAFIKEHKRPIIIGLLIVSIVVIAIAIAPEISPLIATLFPIAADDPNKNSPNIAEPLDLNPISYSEDDFVEDYIELVQESLVANGIDQLQIDESSQATVFDTIKYLGSKISHDLIDAIDDNLSQFKQIPSFKQKLYEIFPSYIHQPNTEESLFASGTENAITYLHQRTDAAFNTCLAENYSQEAKAFRESCGVKKYQGYVPLPGNPLGKDRPIKNILKRFTQNNYRKNLQKADPHPDYASVHAHHVFPQKKILQDRFNAYGINVHDPEYLVWWEKNEHILNKDIYNKRWQDFFNRTPDITKEKILEFGKEIMAEYGIETLY